MTETEQISRDLQEIKAFCLTISTKMGATELQQQSFCERLDELKNDLRGDLVEVKRDLREQITEVKRDLREDVGSVRTELKADVREDIDRIETRVLKKSSVAAGGLSTLVSFLGALLSHWLKLPPD